jgi:hypothetical protein
MHYDCDRDKGDGYPEAHLHVCAEPSGWPAPCSATRGDERPFESALHFPVGGRRYRPALEDLIEFLIVEQIAEARPGALGQPRLLRVNRSWLHVQAPRVLPWHSAQRGMSWSGMSWSGMSWSGMSWSGMPWVRDAVHQVPGEGVGLLDQATQVIAGQAVEHPALVP